MLILTSSLGNVIFFFKHTVESIFDLFFSFSQCVYSYKCDISELDPQCEDSIVHCPKIYRIAFQFLIYYETCSLDLCCYCILEPPIPQLPDPFLLTFFIDAIGMLLLSDSCMTCLVFFLDKDSTCHCCFKFLLFAVDILGSIFI